jgi:hypothetical protein
MLAPTDETEDYIVRYAHLELLKCIQSTFFQTYYGTKDLIECEISGCVVSLFA